MLDVYLVRFHPNANYLATSSQDALIILWDIITGNPIRTFLTKLSLITALKFSNDGKKLSCGDEQGYLYIYNLNDDVNPFYREMVFKQRSIHEIEYKNDDS